MGRDGLMMEPIRAGNRGGAADFKWSDVSKDKDRENYLGHSINAPTGRWQKNKDVHWYNRDKEQTEAERAEEMKRIKAAEAEVMAVALGFKPTVRSEDVEDVPDTSVNEPPQDIQAILAQEAKKREKEEKRARKDERRAEKERRRVEKDARREARKHRHSSRSRERDADRNDLDDHYRHERDSRRGRDTRDYSSRSRSRSPPRRPQDSRRYSDRPPREHDRGSPSRSHPRDRDERDRR